MKNNLEQIRYQAQTMLNEINELNQLAIEELKDYTKIVVQTRHSVFPDMKERLEDIIKNIDNINPSLISAPPLQSQAEIQRNNDWIHGFFHD